MYRCIFPAVLILWPALGHAQISPQLWALAPEIRIGSLNTPDYALTEVGGLAIAPNRDVYVAQPEESLIRVYDADGVYVKSIGGEGAGPGEFRDLDRIGWVGDSLWATDYRQSRISLFGQDGELLDSFGFSGPMLEISTRPTLPAAVFMGGTILGTPLTGGKADWLPILRMNRAGEVIDTLGQLSTVGKNRSIRTESFHISFPLPIPSGSLWGISPADSSVVIRHRPIATSAEAGHFRSIKLRSLADTIFARGYAYSPKPVPATVLDSIRSGYIDFWSRGMRRGQAIQLANDSIPIPAFQPPVNHLAIGRDGTIWLQRENLDKDSVSWLILSPTGSILARLDAPAGLVILQADRNTVWGIIEDEFEVPYVVRYGVRNQQDGGDS